MTEQEFSDDLSEAFRLTRLYGYEANEQSLFMLAKKMMTDAAGGRDIREWADRWLEATDVLSIID